MLDGRCLLEGFINSKEIVNLVSTDTVLTHQVRDVLLKEGSVFGVKLTNDRFL